VGFEEVCIGGVPQEVIAIRDVKMGGERHIGKSDFELLASEDEADGLSIMADNHHSITLLGWSKPLAWFSVAVTGEVLKGFLELVKYCEKRENRQGKRKRN